MQLFIEMLSLCRKLKTGWKNVTCMCLGLRLGFVFLGCFELCLIGLDLFMCLFVCLFALTPLQSAAQSLWKPMPAAHRPMLATAL